MTAGLRFAGFYAAYFAIIGVTQPYWPVWLGAQGMGQQFKIVDPLGNKIELRSYMAAG